MNFAIRVRQLARVFVDAQSLTPTPQELLRFSEAVGLREKLSTPFLMPVAVSDPLGGSPRQAIASQQLDWQLALLGQSFDLTRLPTDATGSNMGDLADFARRAADILSATAQHFGRTPHRLVLIQNGILEEMPSTRMDSIARRLLRLPDAFNANPFEWDWRCGRHGAMRLANADEETNVLATLKRQSGIMQAPGAAAVAFDRIMVELDVNTSPANTRGRFPEGPTREFFALAAQEHVRLDKELSAHALGEPS